jgi:XTP/dITP diphosphohydrolase
MKLIFATHNANKVKEIKSVLPDSLQIISLHEANILEEIPEPFATIEENSLTKAQYIYTMYQQNCFSEDTGLVVPALNGDPGVKSARYAGDHATAEENIAKLLDNLALVPYRQAHFKTVITLMIDGQINQFIGICEGVLLLEKRGDAGFGYDPIFVPNGSQNTFAEMTMEEKNKFSHRKKAMAALVKWLQENESI